MSEEAQLLPGDLFLLVSDGVFEAFAPDSRAFGMARVLDTVRASRHHVVRNLLGLIIPNTKAIFGFV